jgi:hypothetical protein
MAETNVHIHLNECQRGFVGSIEGWAATARSHWWRWTTNDNVALPGPTACSQSDRLVEQLSVLTAGRLHRLYPHPLSPFWKIPAQDALFAGATPFELSVLS